MVRNERIMTMLCRALNLIDARLIDHGMKTAVIVKDMLEFEGKKDTEFKRNLSILALFHDIGAYQKKELDSLLSIETGAVWEHSLYGYLFLKNFSALEEWTKTILYHHVDNRIALNDSEEILKYAQFLHLADRIEIWKRNNKEGKIEQLEQYLDQKKESVFPKEAIDCFWGANQTLQTFEKLDKKMDLNEVIDCRSMKEEEIKTYLWLMVHVIDFRSHFTVAHTVSVVEIACQIGEKMGLSKKEQEQLYYGALLHDIGKIGTPVSILEKEGKLTEEEMKVMKDHIILSETIIQGCVSERVKRIALRHHERLDGSGYPLGLKGEELTLQERIMQVADIVSALSMDRSYKKAFSKEKVWSILNELVERGQIDGQVVKTIEVEYDEIIDRAKKDCEPILEIHTKIAKEYQEELAKLNLSRRELSK